MKLEVFKNSATAKVGRQILIMKKNSPTIMFAAGIVGITGTVVLACRATLKVEDVLVEGEKRLYEAETRRHEKAVKIQTAGKIAKLYAAPVGLGVVSVVALTGSHVTLNKRQAALMAAYKTLDEGFERYRERVIADQGEEKDLEYRRDIREVEVHDTEKGVVQKGRIINPGGGPPSIYARLFDENNQNWNRNPETNFFFLKSVQGYCNNRLQAKGHIFLNEVYDLLGMDHTKPGSVVGWVKEHGDNYVDFGILENQQFLDFIRGDEPIWLDFNVDGVIYDLI